MIHDGCYRDQWTKELLPTITLGVVLWIKSKTPSWNEERLTALYHRNLPDIEDLPGYYLDDRRRWLR